MLEMSRIDVEVRRWGGGVDQTYGAWDRKMADWIERQGKTTIFCHSAPVFVGLVICCGRMHIVAWGLVVSRKRGDDVKQIGIHKASYERGKTDGEAGRRSTVPPGIDGFSYYSGYVEGKAVLERTKCPLFVPDDCRKERG